MVNIKKAFKAVLIAAALATPVSVYAQENIQQNKTNGNLETIVSSPQIPLTATRKTLTLGEGQLAGILLLEHPTALLNDKNYGPADAMIVAGVYNPRVLSAETSGGIPSWIQAVWFEGLNAEQSFWAYNKYPNKNPVAVSFLINGGSYDAEITDIVVSLWDKLITSNYAQTKKGIILGDKFEKVLQRYGWPEEFTVFQGGSSAQTATQAAATAPIGISMRGIFRAPTIPSPVVAPRQRLGGGGGFRARRDRRDDEEETPAFAPAPAPAPYVAPTTIPSTPAVPGVSPFPSPATSQEYGGHFSGIIFGQQMNLSRHMVLGYPTQGIDFYLYQMQVVRMHVYNVPVGITPTTPTTPIISPVPYTPFSQLTRPTLTPRGTSTLRGLFRDRREREE